MPPSTQFMNTLASIVHAVLICRPLDAGSYASTTATCLPPSDSRNARVASGSNFASVASIVRKNPPCVLTVERRVAVERVEEPRQPAQADEREQREEAREQHRHLEEDRDERFPRAVLLPAHDGRVVVRHQVELQRRGRREARSAPPASVNSGSRLRVRPIASFIPWT